MAHYSSIRAASGASHRNAINLQDTRTRVPSAPPVDDTRPQAAGGYRLNGSDRRAERRSPIPSGGGVSSNAQSSREQLYSHQHTNGSRHASTTRRAGADAARAPSWSPQVTLIPTTSAPLAVRVSAPPLSSTLPDDLQPIPLAELSVQEQESAILEDLLFVLMGFEGEYIRFDTSYNPSEEKQRLTGPEFRISRGLDPSLRDLASSLLKMSSHYMALEAFVEVQSREEFGAVNHALCAAIRKLLKDYLMLIAQLEHQLLTNENFTLHFLSLHTRPTSHMLLQLYSVAHEILMRNAILDEDLDDTDDMNDVDNIIESLREGNNADGVDGKKVCKGGSVLGLITKRLASMSGDPAARSLLTMLLRESSRPYMQMLNEWLHHGVIRDRHAEFLIKEQKSIRREGLEQDYTDEYWEKRYTVREPDVPPQLEVLKEKVLLAGKYLNVVRECGGADASREVKDVPLTFEDSRFVDNVNAAYAHANSSLLALLLTTHGLPARLRSLKHYFFLDRSDFFSYFLELAASELRKPAKNVNSGKLQSLLDLVLHQPGSLAAEDPYKEDVKISLNDISLTTWLMRVVNVTGLEQDSANNASNLLTPAPPSASTEDKDLNGFDALVLDYAVPFPLSLVVSRVTLTRYQLLFRYLLSLRHLETLLLGAWTEHSKVSSWRKKSSNPRVELWKRKAWTLRARMLCFVQQLLYYCTAEVIEPNWLALMARLEPQAESQPLEPGQFPVTSVKRTVDEIMQDHVDFLATCLKECMLTNSKLLKINSKVTSTCTMFANYTPHLSRYLAAADAEDDASKLDKLVEVLEKYEYNFSRHLKILLDALNYLAATETVVFLSLCARLSMASEGTPGMTVGGYG